MSRKVLHWDIESYSAIDLRKVGVHRYSEDPSTNVWLAALAVDDGPIEMWYPGQPCPDVVQQAVREGWLWAAWNCNFERIMLDNVISLRYGWPKPAFENWRCPMSFALAMGMPAALERAAPAFGLDITKDAQGAALMLRMARPRRFESDGSPLFWNNDSEKLERLARYCENDVRVEREIWKRLVPLTQSEQELYLLDALINDRGVYIDRAFCEAANKIAAEAAEKIKDGMISATGGSVPSCTNVGKLKEFCADNGVEVDTLRKDDVVALLASDDLPGPVREALELRQVGAKASVGKVDSALAGRSADGRAKGLFFFHGATTGRWASRRVQVQNLQRPEKVDVEAITADILRGELALVELLYGAPLAAISNAIRGIIIAAPGNQLIAADFSNIESRVLAWLAGEQHALDKFRAGLDAYKVAYGAAFGIAPEAVSDYQRQIGKVIVLALGFGGGVGAFLSAAKVYSVDIGSSYDLLCKALPEAAERAKEAYEARGKAGDTPRETWIAAETVKLGWRDAHPNIVAFWKNLEEGAIRALNNPGEKVICGKLCFLKRGSFMWLRLPSGRPLCYPYPSLTEKEMPWLDNKGNKVKKLTFTYKTEIKRQFVESHAYGGLWAENVTQAAARDLLAEAMKRLEAAGYPVVSHAHDEVVAEVASGYGSVETFCEIMSEVPQWATGCPVSAAGWIGPRYRKA